MKADRLSSLFWMAIALFFIYGAIQMGVGTLSDPGTGFFAFLAGSFIVLMALFVFFQSFFRGRGFQAKLSSLWPGGGWRRPIVVSFLMVGYCFILEGVGFLLSSILLLSIMFIWVVNFSWWKAVLISVLASAITNLLFSTLLKSTLPRGIFGF